MKKGFTLIEIIISISIILIISLSVAFFVLKNDSNVLEKTTSKILTAANLYVKTEFDKDGENYIEMIQNGKKGVAITIEQLVNKGYISEKDANIIYDNNARLEDNQDYYVMFINGGEGLDSYKEEYCEIGQIKILPSWVEKSDTPIYLCENNYMDNTLFGKIVNDFNNGGISGCIPGKEDGVCYFKRAEKTINQNGIYYYTGDVSNNYLKIGEDLFYIVRTTENNDVKVIAETTLPYGSADINFTGSNYSYDYSFQYAWGKDTYFSYYFKVAQTGDTSSVYYEPSSSSPFVAGKLVFDKTPFTSCAPIYNLSLEETNYPSNLSDSKSYSYVLALEEMLPSAYCDVSKLPTTISVKSFAYNHIYKPIYNWYDERKNVLDDLIVSNYKWCFKNTISDYFSSTFEDIPIPDFTCEDDKYIYSGNFGLLTSSEYSAITKRNGYGLGSNMYGISLTYHAGGELMGDFYGTYLLTSHLMLPHGTYISAYSPEYGGKLRPALVLKGDLIVESGNGTREEPNILKIN